MTLFAAEAAGTGTNGSVLLITNSFVSKISLYIISLIITALSSKQGHG